MTADPDSYAPLGPHCLTPAGVQKDLIDPYGGMISMGRNHHEIHEGDFYSFGYTFIDVADTAIVYVRFLTAAKELHYGVQVDAEGKSYAFLYKGTTYTAAGTTVPLINNNCSSSNTAVTTSFYTPTIDVLGSLISPENGVLVPGGLGPQSVGGNVKSDEERIACASTDYLVAVQNVSGQAKDITIQLAGYEETPLA